MRLVPGACALAVAVLAGSAAGLGSTPAPAVLSCDGTTDNVTALNQGLAHGGLVTLPPGVCMTSGTIRVPAGTILVGAGVGSTIIRAFPHLQTDLVDALGKVDISNLTVDGAATAVNLAAPNIHLMAGSNGSKVHDLETMNAGSVGVVVQSTNSQVVRVYAHNNWKQGIYVIGVAVNRTRISGVVIAQNMLRQNVLGLSLTGTPGDGIDIDVLTQNVTVRNNTVYDNDIILYESGATADQNGVTRATGHVVTANQVINSQANGADVTGAVDSFIITGNTFANETGFGIIVHGDSRGGQITNNTIDGTTNEGLDVAPLTVTAPSGLVITGNTFEAVPPLFATIDLKGNTSNDTISGNFLDGGRILTSATSSNVVIQNNN